MQTEQATGLSPRLESMKERRTLAAQLFGDNRYVDRKECSAFLGVGLTKFQEIKERKDFPKPFRTGRFCRWQLGEIRTWIEQKRLNGESI